MKISTAIPLFLLFCSAIAEPEAPFVPDVVFQQDQDLYDRSVGPENIKLPNGEEKEADMDAIVARMDAIIDPTPSRLAVYSNGKSEIIVKDLDYVKTVKLFTIQIEQPTGGLSVDDENDLIFFAHKDHVYRIHLVDDDGERKISGTGELLRNHTANHVELSYRFKTEGDNCHLVFDKMSQMLYLICQHGYFKIDSETMTKVGYGPIGLQSPSNFVLSNGMLYAKAYNRKRKAFFLYNTTIHAIESRGNKVTGPKWTRLVHDDESIDRFVVDPVTNRIFFSKSKNILGLVQNINNQSPLATSRSRVVLADSAFTRDIGSMRVDGDVVVWSSNAWKVFFVGKLNKNKNFLLRQNIQVLDNHLYGPEHDISSNIVTINV